MSTCLLLRSSDAEWSRSLTKFTVIIFSITIILLVYHFTIASCTNFCMTNCVTVRLKVASIMYLILQCWWFPSHVHLHIQEARDTCHMKPVPARPLLGSSHTCYHFCSPHPLN
ncbi:hypothetical protein DPEC_G00332580 [Dallia pectoralis]|uniref:Uncharacterized protein n=1 Tax=Dallia pectoralis TaxID=75939 RepID=A0ACC2F6C8_DALPE|nr:hypothetical protein DPEC_G00332580 [Dallia pectoralis]